MKVFLVGGAVRDYYLGRTPKDRDFLVIESSHENMLKNGFRPVGKDHQVYLHPDTKDEYTLSHDLTDDLRRRDLTINAMAMHENELVDPFGGLNDLQNKTFQHVEENNFYLDPLRVYRTLRLSAELPDFRISPETISLITSVIESEAFFKILPERILKELQKVFLATTPSTFFIKLKELGGLIKHFPELHGLASDKFYESMKLLDRTRRDKKNSSLAVASLAIHLNPEEADNLSERLLFSNEWKKALGITARYYVFFKESIDLEPHDVVAAFYGMDAYRNEASVKLLSDLLKCSGADKQNIRLWDMFKLSQEIKMESLVTHYQGRELGEAIYQQRIKLIRGLGP